jgi:hypothetical protein
VRLCKAKGAATPARKGRSFSNHKKKRTRPAKSTSPICPATRQAGTGPSHSRPAKIDYWNRSSNVNFPAEPIATNSEPNESTVQRTQAPNGDRNPNGTTRNQRPRRSAQNQRFVCQISVQALQFQYPHGVIRFWWSREAIQPPNKRSNRAPPHSFGFRLNGWQVNTEGRQSSSHQYNLQKSFVGNSLSST